MHHGSSTKKFQLLQSGPSNEDSGLPAWLLGPITVSSAALGMRNSIPEAFRPTFLRTNVEGEGSSSSESEFRDAARLFASTFEESVVRHREVSQIFLPSPSQADSKVSAAYAPQTLAVVCPRSTIA